MSKRIQEIFNTFDQINKDIPLLTIKLTAGQLSLILDSPNLSMSYSIIEHAGNLINADYLSVYENKFVLSLYEDSYAEADEVVRFLGNVVADMADVICACTGNEIRISKNDIKCYLDIQEFDIQQFEQINNLFEDTGLIIFDIRPYILFKRDIEETNIIVEEIGD